MILERELLLIGKTIQNSHILRLTWLTLNLTTHTNTNKFNTRLVYNKLSQLIYPSKMYDPSFKDTKHDTKTAILYIQMT